MALGAQAIVIDNGSYSMKCGFGGYPAPTSVFPTVLALPKNGTKMLIGDAALKLRETTPVTLRCPIDSEHGITNRDHMSAIWRHVFTEKLKSAPEEHPVLMTAQPLYSHASIEHTTQEMFEEWNVPAFYVAVAPVLALYASGRTQGLVVDCGRSCTQQVCVFESTAYAHVTNKFRLGGDDITKLLLELLNEHHAAKLTDADFQVVNLIKEMHADVAYQRFDDALETSVSLLEKYRIPAKGMFSELARWTQALSHTYFGALPADLRRQVLQYSFTEEVDVVVKHPVKETVYTLPDGRRILLGGEKWRCTEILMQPTPLVPPLSSDVYKACMKAYYPDREDYFHNIVLAGGGSCFPGMAERLKNGIQELLAPRKWQVKVHAPPNRAISAWIGGSLVASLSTFKQMWISKEQYDETGPSVVHRQ